ncbi:RHS repeat-associated protein [Kitasatospora viridis]|uniref:RHS repeat-associated protein n=2 Tax=Kitasatospora viridis TaxID=281105 RepID=A0A561UNF5_9ACTN|nr:RHS repeat-associated protein [Kitasatospora viridis]
MVFAALLTLVVAPSTTAFAAARLRADRIWNPPNTPLGSATKPVKGVNLKPTGVQPPRFPVPTTWKPVPVPTGRAGKSTVTVGADSPEARAARAATGGTSSASAGGTPVQAGELPVFVSAAPDTAAVTRSVAVAVTDAGGGSAAGAETPLVSLTGQAADRLQVKLDVNALGGGPWADRARLVELPACALTTPTAAQCRTQTPVAATLDTVAGTLTADVALPAAKASSEAAGTAQPDTAQGANGAADPMVLAAAPTPNGPAGNYAATSLNPSMSWTAGSNAGTFTYSYPIQLPPPLGGSAPTVALSYDSSAVDGKTSAQNAQSSWIGAGWDYQPGFIERSYKPCSKDGIANSGDQCWAGQNAVISIAGHSGPIVRDDATGVWRLQSDNGSKIEQLTGAPNGLPTGEYWRLTTSDGTQYYFGQNHLPGGDGSDTATNSAWGVPVYSPNPGDPCYSSSSGQASSCTMGWRWNLDYVVDPHQNLTTYTYTPETNQYLQGGGQNSGKGTAVGYTRGGNLKTIAYGQRLSEQVAAKGILQAAALVTFNTSERCLPSGTITCDPSQRTKANQSYWPDVPLDQVCDGTTSCSNYTPSFFTTKRLTSITTSVLVGNSYSSVDTWALSQSLLDPGDGTPASLWLSSITHTGSTGGTTTSLPAVTFTAVEKPNRVAGLVPAEPAFNQPRIQQITTETGGQTNVIYSDPACTQTSSPVEDSNTKPCMPVKWYLPGSSSTTPVSDWFNKYLVTEVTQQDGTTGAVLVRTDYTYNGDAAWHRDDSPYIDPATRSWDSFRGYQSVTITTGGALPGEAPKTQQTVTYLRGMDGDYKADGTQRSVSVASPLGGTVTDSNWLAGSTLATQAFNQAGGQPVSMTGSSYGNQQTTATQAEPGGMPPLIARYGASQATSTSQSALANGSWRTTKVVTTTDPAHGNRVLTSDDLGDGTNATPEICTTDSYATSSNPSITSLLDETKAVAGSCGTAPTATNTVSDARTLFDNLPFGQVGPAGDPTSTQKLDHYDTSGNPVYTNTGAASYDIYGRLVGTSTSDGSTYGPSGTQLTSPSVVVATTTTAYTPATGALPTKVASTGPTGWVQSITQDPGRLLPLTSTDPNGEVTTEQYDGLGRLTAMWAPDRATNLSATVAYTYAVNGTSAPSTVTTRTLRETLPGSTDFSWQTQIYDGLGRLRQTQQTNPTGGAGRLISDAVYDSHGWTVKSSAPYWDPNTLPNSTVFSPQDSQVPAQTWSTYDGMGRVTNSAFMSYAQPQWSTTTSYPGVDRTDTTPPQGGDPVSKISDARGRTTALWQYHTTNPTGQASDADVTTYGYTPGGQLASRTDSSGNAWTYHYDLQGRQTSATDPDTGTSQVFYDVNSRVDHTVDAKGGTIAYSYDTLGRKTGTYTGSVSPANQLAGWTYDTLAKGQLTSSTRYVGGSSGQAYTEAVTGYDTAYRPQGTSITIPSSEGGLAGTYTTSTTYNPVLGTVATTTLPALGGLPSETVGYDYTVTGSLLDSAGNDYLVDRVVTDAYGRPTRTTVGAPGNQVVSTQQWDQATGHLITSWIDRQTETVSADKIGYTYNPAGAVTSVTDNQDATTTDRQCFTYDYLGRLTNAWTDTGGTTTRPTGAWTDSSGATQGSGASASVPGIGGCTNANGPAGSGSSLSIGGPAPYWQTYGYDATGNRKTLVQHDPTGNTAKDITTTETFGAPGSLNTPTSAPNTGGGTGGPHALLSSTTSAATGNSTASYQYDPLGNTTSVTGTSGTTTLTWDGEDKLSSATTTGQQAGTTYLYDADGNQLIRRDPGKTTVNLGPDELTLDTSSGSTSDVRYYGSPGGITVTRVTAATGGGTLVYQAADPHGTSSIQIANDAAQTVTRRLSDPFGNPRGTQPATGTWSGDKAFVAGTLDPATGLTNLGAREYQPATGRFLNPDPVIADADPQQWNGYAYGDNDPTNLSDPNGTCPADICGAGTPIGGTGTGGTPVRYVADGSGIPSQSLTFGQPAHVTTSTAKNPYDVPYKEDKGDIYIWGVRVPSQKELDARAETDSKDYGHNLTVWAQGVCDGGFDDPQSPSPVDNFCNAASKVGLLGGNMTGRDPFGIADVIDCVGHGKNCTAAVVDVALLAVPAGLGKVAEALRGADAVGAAADAAGGLAADGERSIVEQLAGCTTNSFPGNTQVVLADGSSKPIDQVRVGDHVLATDPQSGQTKAEPVTATITTPDDQDLTDLAIQDPHGTTTGALTTTWHHPFWDVTEGKWVDASQLKPGEQLRRPDSSTTEVVSVHNRHGDLVTHNLTVAQIHTYYVLAGNTPVLVHNSDGPCGTHLALGLTQERASGANLAQFAGEQGAVIWKDPQFADLFPNGSWSDTALRSMIDRVVSGGGKISFNLQGVQDVEGVIAGRTAPGLPTSIELQHICGSAGVRAATTFLNGSAPC